MFFCFPETRRSISRTSEKCITSGELLKQGYKSRETSVLIVSCDRSLRFSFIIESQIFSIPWPNWTEVCAKKGNFVKLPFLRCPGSEQILRRAFLCLASTQLNRPRNVVDEGCFEGKFKSKSSIQGVCICSDMFSY